MNLLINLFSKNYFLFIFTAWALMGITVFITSFPYISKNLNQALKLNGNVFTLISVCYLLLTILITLLSTLNGENLNRRIIITLILCRDCIKENGSINPSQLTSLLNYWNNLTYPFQNQIINNNEISIPLISAEIKNHVMKSSIFWMLLRSISGFACYFFYLYALYFLIIHSINNEINLIWIAIICVFNGVLFFLHFYFCGYIQRKKIYYTNQFLRFFSPWEYSEETSQ